MKMKLFSLLMLAGLFSTTISACKNGNPETRKADKTYSDQDFCTEWKTENENYYFYNLKPDGSAEIGQYNANSKNINPAISDSQAFWELNEITWQEFNMKTGNFEEKTAVGIIVTDSKGYSYKLEIVSKKNSAIFLVDHENLGPYNTFKNGTVNKKLHVQREKRITSFLLSLLE